MAIRIKCPACDTSNTVDEEKRGRKVRCRHCEELLSVPKRRGAEEGIQESPKVAGKAGGSRRQGEDETDDPRPIRKKDQSAKGGFPVLLVAGAGVAVLFLLLVIGGAIGAIFFFRSKPAVENQDQQAKADPAPPPQGELKGLPAELPPEAVPGLKQATVYLRVTMPTGQ